MFQNALLTSRLSSGGKFRTVTELTKDTGFKRPTLSLRLNRFRGGEGFVSTPILTTAPRHGSIRKRPTNQSSVPEKLGNKMG
ncbi:Protein of unknown function [Pyronema omphalodes CBS 100304]|uniref:Uncharacterized protein n=1 Tax=Pyronema omphalodes (strain CBS 100304) TaxID=1076935 RepID=U4L3Q2_PYROM|nr:Protein of unknown function [Pyronema omphalodes CBS 100304]